MASNTPGGTGHPQQVGTAERRAFVLNLRRGGADYRSIAEAAVRKFGTSALPNGWDSRYAWKDVARELRKLHAETAGDAADVRQMQLERYNRLLLAVWERALNGDLGALDRAMKLVQSICQLTGANAPAGLDLTTGGQPVTFRVVREDIENNDA
jgi:hypothetical protein